MPKNLREMLGANGAKLALANGESEGQLRPAIGCKYRYDSRALFGAPMPESARV
jgi:hypothetical protein